MVTHAAFHAVVIVVHSMLMLKLLSINGRMMRKLLMLVLLFVLLLELVGRVV